jgi:hypothetical protein
LEARVVAPAQWAVEAQEPGVFSENAVEQQDWAGELSLKEEKQILQVKLVLQAVVQR